MNMTWSESGPFNNEEALEMFGLDTLPFGLSIRSDPGPSIASGFSKASCRPSAMHHGTIHPKIHRSIHEPEMDE